jgi:hypothetical protein
MPVDVDAVNNASNSNEFTSPAHIDEPNHKSRHHVNGNPRRLQASPTLWDMDVHIIIDVGLADGSSAIRVSKAVCFAVDK